jgi:hypothetical protein
MSFRATVRRLPALVPLLLAVSLLTIAIQAVPTIASPLADQAGFTLGGQPCSLIGVPVASPIGGSLTRCNGVRPGAMLNTETGVCSLNFMFTGSDGNRYMGTAGHCILVDSTTGALAASAVSKEEVYTPGSGPTAMDGDGTRIGQFAYAILSDPKDFALIRLDRGVEASPQMCHFGGPTGLNADRPPLTEPVVLNQYGQGVALGSLLPARSLLALGMPDPHHVFAQGVVLPGDSGSGVISSDGRAVGVAVSTGAHMGGVGTGGLDTGLVGITRLTPQLERAEKVLGVDLEMVTAPPL